MLTKKRLDRGLIITPDDIGVEGVEGEIKVSDASKRLQIYLEGSLRTIVTQSQTQPLTNKTIDSDLNTLSNIKVADLKAGVLDTDLTSVSAADDTIPSAKATKTYVDATAASTAAGVQTNLDTHIADTSTHGTTGAIVGTTDTQTLQNKTIDASLNTISNIGDSNISASGISASTIISPIPLKAIIADGDGKLSPSATSATELSYVSGVTSGIQSQLNSKASTTDLTTHASTTSTHGVTGDIVGTGNTQTLTNKTLTAPVLDSPSITTPSRLDVKQDTFANLVTYASSATNGQIVFGTDTKQMYQVIDGSLTAIGSGGGISDADILAAQSFDTATLADFTQTGLGFNAVNPIHGSQSAHLIHQASINQSFKQTIAVDRKFRGQLIQLSLNVRSTAAEGNLTLLVTDETNSTTIAASQPISTGSFQISATTTSASTTISGLSNVDVNKLYVGMGVSGAGIANNTLISSINTAAGTAVLSIAATASTTVTLSISPLPIARTFSFTIPTNCASLSYTVTALPQANTPRSTIDDIVIRLASTALLSTTVDVPVVTAWQSYTPTFQGFGTPSNIEFQWRQNGENVEVRGKFTSGTSTAVEARVGLPNGYTSANTSKIPSIQLVGDVTSTEAGTAVVNNLLIEPSVSYFTFAVRSASTANALTKITGSAYITSGSIVSFFASVPVSGLSATTTKTIPLTQSGLIQDADSYFQMNNFSIAAASTNTQIITTGTPVNLKSLGTAVTYNRNATLGDTIVANADGTYTVNIALDSSSTTGYYGLSKNSTQLTTAFLSINDSDKLTTSSLGEFQILTWTGKLVTGDALRIHQQSLFGTSESSPRMFLSVAYQGSLKQVSVNTNSKATIPTHELRFEGASSRGSTATAIVKFDTLAKIRGDGFTVTNDAVNGTYVTINKAGKLDVSCSLVNTGSNAALWLTKNQSNLTTSPIASEIIGADSVVTTSGMASTSASIYVNVGDIIRVSMLSSPTTNVINNFILSLQEQSVQVSVSNTLPQFSDSDSAVRVTSSPGRGSSGTAIVRFSNVKENIGTDISYIDDATNGGSFTVMSDGIYNMSFSYVMGTNGAIGITKNQATLTQDITTVSEAERLCIEELADTGINYGTVSTSVRLAKGDVIRANANVATSSAANCQFSITKVGKPNVTGVDVTPFVNIPQSEISELRFEGASTRGSTATSIIKFDTIAKQTGSYFSIANDTINGTAVTILKEGDLSVSYNLLGSTTCSYYITRNQSVLTTSPIASEQLASNSGVTTPFHTTASWKGRVFVGDVIRIGSNGTSPAASVINNFNLSLETAASSILTAPQTFSTDTANLQYASSAQYTLATLNTAPVGTFITFTYASSTNTRTQTTTAPTQVTSDMNVNGIQLFTRAYNAASTAASPAAVAIQIGKGLKGFKPAIYKSTGKTTGGSLTYYVEGAVEYGPYYNIYDETTGIYYLDFGATAQSTNTVHNIAFNDLTTPTSCYLTVNASTNPALTGMNVVIPRIATLSHQLASGTAGGSAAATTTQTRVLNTIVDSYGIVTSLASNQFTLPAGTYYMEGYSAAYTVDSNRSRIRNITDGTTVILGSSEQAGSATTGATIKSNFAGEVSIASSKTFELQHYTQSAKATNGLGLAASSGENEIYAIVKIQKVK